jgi:hypothetical protein
MENIYKNLDESQIAKLCIPDKHKKLCVSVSSGTDSALVLYLVCSYLTEHKRYGMEITVLHCVDLVRAPKSKPDFDLIIDRFETEFSNIKFVRRYIQFIESKTESKGSAIKRETAKIIAKEGIESFFGGRTKNPPKEICESFGELPPALIRREAENVPQEQVLSMLDKYGKKTENTDDCIIMISRFLGNVDRSFVAEYYNKIEFLKKLFPLTKSCISSNITDTVSWTKPCMKCWWCKEKFWAFRQYDGGSIE